MSEQIKLSIGCGKTPRDGFIGLDIVDFGWNKIYDATKDQIPMGESTVNFIEAHNFMEHIERKYWKFWLNECWRVLKPSGILEIITPDANKSISLALQDPTHVSMVVQGTFTQYFAGGRPRNADYGFKKWIIDECRNYDEKEPRDIFVRMKPNK